ncbi:ArsA family ATPase [Salipaludibacillus agaradhaerens]|uniref:ArsA family ATPase n=1 Tax=Salipaludibacillus agaradhaerens TaxID=76935 RepID=UPI0023EE8026|nr:ArsA family ATPase [Salipaludibacillus agaradhaerens]
MNKVLQMMLNKKIIFCGGKGGVGKSTTASSLAIAATKHKKKVLLISTDPAHNLADLFHTSLSHKPKKVAENLSVIEIDSEKETDRYISQVKQHLKHAVKATMIEEVNRQLDLAKTAPGAEESALFQRLTTLIVEEKEHYDLLIIDTAPTGHTLRLITLPELMGAWMDGMIERRGKTMENYTQLIFDGQPVDDPIYRVLEERKEMFAKVRHTLLNKTETAFVFVVNPEKLPIQETFRAVTTLKRHDFPVSALIINKILPEEVEGVFFKARKRQQHIYLKEIETVFSGIPTLCIPLLKEDITHVGHLAQVAHYLSDDKNLK